MEARALILLIVFMGALAATGVFIYIVCYAAFGSLISRVMRETKERKMRKARVPGHIPHPLTLTRTKKNPILSPYQNEWEGQAVLNPGAVEVEDKTHLFYRAIGDDGVSRIGHAASEDGTEFDERSPYPVFALERERDPYNKRQFMENMYPELVASGGSWGGTEDPRAVTIDGKVYVTFSAFHNWDSVRMTAISIDEADVAKGRWNWSKPTFLSAPNQVHKNWMLFPEKIKGKFAVLHSIFPKVEVAYVDDLSAVGRSQPYIESYTGARVAHADHYTRSWHERVRGAGPPPIRTPFGWLLIYHAMEKGDMSRYKMGAMLLDEKDPSKVIARAQRPILEPNAWYENEGKPGVVYACGATVKDGLLRIYYGGGDRVICSATAHLSSFVRSLMNSRAPSLSPA